MAKQAPLRPLWTDHSNETQRHRPRSILRIGPKGAVGIIITAEKYVGAPIHFWRKRSRPHTHPICPACDDGNMKRWTYWVSAWLASSGEQVILEITDAAVDALNEYLQQRGSLRGAEVKAYRQGGRPNGRLVLNLVPCRMPIAAIPPAFDVKSELERMWEANTHNEPADPTNGKAQIKS